MLRRPCMSTQNSLDRTPKKFPKIMSLKLPKNPRKAKRLIRGISLTVPSNAACKNPYLNRFPYLGR